MNSQFIVELSCFDCTISRKSVAGLCHKMSAYMNKKIYNTYVFHWLNSPLIRTKGFPQFGYISQKLKRILEFN